MARIGVQIYEHTDKLTYGRTCVQIIGRKQTCVQTGWEKYTHAARQGDRTEEQTDKQTDMHTDA